MLDLHLIKMCITKTPEVVAAYLFGSAASAEQTVNDLDILVFLSEGSKSLETQFVLMKRLSKVTEFKPDRIDIVVFDLDEVEPVILQKAINQGILLINNDPDFLSCRIEELSGYFMKNEPMIHRAELLKKERMEAFCETR
ncbi:MAG: nucleotidyltransferase domain-containing protein [Thermodesulfobacteriota bacterium]|nr:nucleotidyltransferase domain-containing protein [Thermodesulfobacteriota bacterium]